MTREQDACILTTILYCVSVTLCRFDRWTPEGVIQIQCEELFPSLYSRYGTASPPSYRGEANAECRVLVRVGRGRRPNETVGCCIRRLVEGDEKCTVFIRIPLLRRLLLDLTERVGLSGGGYVDALIQIVIKHLNLTPCTCPGDCPPFCRPIVARGASAVGVELTPRSLARLYKYADMCYELSGIFKDVAALRTYDFRRPRPRTRSRIPAQKQSPE